MMVHHRIIYLTEGAAARCITKDMLEKWVESHGCILRPGAGGEMIIDIPVINKKEEEEQ